MIRLEVKKELHSHSCAMRALQIGDSYAKFDLVQCYFIWQQNKVMSKGSLWNTL